jgi:predicted nucleotide-binding protein
MARLFTVGLTIPEMLEKLAGECDAAIAIATPDDLASTALNTESKRARARQNVWVEVGWFWGRLGRSHVLLLVRGKLETPSDLDGMAHHTYSNSVMEMAPKIESFLAHIGEKLQ